MRTEDRRQKTEDRGATTVACVLSSVFCPLSSDLTARGSRATASAMSNRTLNLTESLYDYLLANSLREPPLLARLREETATLPMARMQIAPEQGQFMRLLVELIGGRRTIEGGTFPGCSAL